MIGYHTAEFRVQVTLADSVGDDQMDVVADALLDVLCEHADAADVTGLFSVDGVEPTMRGAHDGPLARTATNDD